MRILVGAPSGYELAPRRSAIQSEWWTRFYGEEYCPQAASGNANSILLRRIGRYELVYSALDTEAPEIPTREDLDERLVGGGQRSDA